MSPYCKADARVLENPMRAAIADFLHQEPGVTFTQILRHLRGIPEFADSVGNGALMWHLSRLERAGLVSSRRSGRNRLYYPASGPRHADLSAFAALRGTVRVKLAVALDSSPASTLHELHARLAPEMNKKTALRQHLKTLSAMNLVDASRLGRTNVYGATARLRRALDTLPARRFARVSGPTVHSPGPGLETALNGRHPPRITRAWFVPARRPKCFDASGPSTLQFHGEQEIHTLRRITPAEGEKP